MLPFFSKYHRKSWSLTRVFRNKFRQTIKNFTSNQKKKKKKRNSIVRYYYVWNNNDFSLYTIAHTWMVLQSEKAIVANRSILSSHLSTRYEKKYKNVLFIVFNVDYDANKKFSFQLSDVIWRSLCYSPFKNGVPYICSLMAKRKGKKESGIQYATFKWLWIETRPLVIIKT